MSRRPRLVDVVEGGLLVAHLEARDGQQPLHGDLLLDDALELVVEEVDLVHLVARRRSRSGPWRSPGPPGSAGPGRCRRARYGSCAAGAGRSRGRLRPTTLDGQLAAPRAAPGTASPARMMLALKPPARPLSAVTTTSRMRLPLRSTSSGWASGFARAAMLARTSSISPGEGAGREHRLLGPAQLRRRDHLHGLGDLLRVLDRLRIRRRMSTMAGMWRRCPSTPSRPWRAGKRWRTPAAPP